MWYTESPGLDGAEKIPTRFATEGTVLDVPDAFGARSKAAGSWAANRPRTILAGCREGALQTNLHGLDGTDKWGFA